MCMEFLPPVSQALNRVQGTTNLGHAHWKAPYFPSLHNLDKYLRLTHKVPIALAEQLLAARLVSPVSCSPQPAGSCTQHTGISSEIGCDSENWNFHKQRPMRQPPSPGQGHQGQGSEPPFGEGVRETILLAFCISLSVCQDVLTGTQGYPQR